MLDGFTAHDLPTTRGAIHAQVGGEGPPLLLLHGYPETHLMWRPVAAQLAERFTVVAIDLPGYGASYRPAVAEDHAPHSKRTWGEDARAAMAELGFDAFAVVGHDRGARVAYRMALDAPEAVTRLAVLDVVPTGEVWGRADERFAFGYWHWAFLAQPAPLPEHVISAAPDAYWEGVQRMGVGRAEGRWPEDVVAAYRAQLDDPAHVEAICEDYRAGATIDRAIDDEDRAAGRTIGCPTFALWASQGALPLFYDDPLAIWREWASDVQGHAIDGSHFFVEDAPEATLDALLGFLA